MFDQMSESMRKSVMVSLIAAGLMFATAAMTRVVTPEARMADRQAAINLEHLIPRAFGDWVEDAQSGAGVVNPQTEAALKKIYAETLSRTYINSSGQRIMLSIAYGSDQAGEGTQAHRPEICYSASGFAIRSNQVGVLDIDARHIPVRRLIAVNGARNEPITYWMTVGDEATLPGLSRKIAQISYGLMGSVPDGLLFRVSSIQPDAAPAYALQASFVRAMFGTLDSEQQARLAGKIRPV